MRKRLLIVAGLAAVMAAGSAVAIADPFDSERPNSGMDSDLLDSKLKALQEAGAPAVIAEVRDGDGVWEGAAGERVLGENTPPEPTDRVRASSVALSMIATVALQLADEGELDLDAPIDEYLPDVLPYEDTITTRQMLNHTSGVPDYFVHIYGSLHQGDPTDVRDNRLNEYTPEELIAMATEKPLDFEPGSKFAYSNTGYTVIGLLIEDLTGKSIEDAIGERVLDPAGLDDTYMMARDGELVVEGPHPNGYFDAGDGKEMIDVSELHPSQFWAGVAAVSNPRDINRFYKAMSDGTLLSPERLAEARELSPQSEKTYGLGLQAFVKLPDNCAPIPDRIAYGHGGDGMGYLTWTAHSPDANRQVTFTFTLGYELNPTEELNKAWRGLLYAGLCDVDINDPAVSKTLPDQSPMTLESAFR
ncbi:serine hydrolase domain-containing protein [Stackebrandtia nassauensis]|uniref:Beta-lactamase n=1 Tax=Stackebrandtia nassauensis (strain DSM 44728 / CIP 108903 / NRRL B-16338 / NBRC 102104 / LLR-40K-21) TaxID=446470 RepID=D3PUK5_STANL|nr:serine hydrolase domain-containing protein [Stackebrandtia nassauensis]ADD43018.1 beta-lactamase [Stackebrandtia nassauensis DSM 44728]